MIFTGELEFVEEIVSCIKVNQTTITHMKLVPIIGDDEKSLLMFIDANADDIDSFITSIVKTNINIYTNIVRLYPGFIMIRKKISGDSKTIKFEITANIKKQMGPHYSQYTRKFEDINATYLALTTILRELKKYITKIEFSEDVTLNVITKKVPILEVVGDNNYRN